MTYGTQHIAGVTVGNEFMLKSALLTLNLLNTNSSIQLPHCPQYQGPQRRYRKSRFLIVRILRNAFPELVTLGAKILTANIADTRKMLSELNLNKTIQVGNSDAGGYFNAEVLEAVDYGVSFDLYLKVESILHVQSAIQCPCVVRQHDYPRCFFVGDEILSRNKRAASFSSAQQSKQPQYRKWDWL